MGNIGLKTLDSLIKHSLELLCGVLGVGDRGGCGRAMLTK